MWLLLARFWKPLAGLVVVLGLLWWVRHQGYQAGEASRDAYWKPRFEQAERDLIVANARTAAKDELARNISRDADIRYAQTLANLNTRFVDADRSIRGLVRELAARAGGGEVSADAGATGSADAASTGDERLERAAAGFGDLARRCEADALRLVEFQRWVTEQRAALN
jgi:hypothetical protein